MGEVPSAPWDVVGNEGDKMREQHFINRFSVAKPVVEFVISPDLPEEQFVEAVNGFNQDRDELDPPYTKDYLRISNGRTIAMYWDDKNNVRLGYSLPQKKEGDGFF